MTRRVAQLALALVLVTPLVARAHVHGGAGDLSPACGVCTVAKHTPAMVGALAAATATIVATERVAIEMPGPLVSGWCWRPAGRAPPAPSVARHP